MLKKIDIIRDAYSKLRISGITVNPSPEDITLALNRLENLATELMARNVCISWNVVDDPDVNDYHNLERQHYDAMSTMLATRVPYDFGKALPGELLRSAKAASSFLYSDTAVKKQTTYPARQPRGAGNRGYGGYRRNFYSGAQNAPPDCSTKEMRVGEIDIFTKHYDSYLKDNETITTVTIEADTGLTIVRSELVSPDFTYTIQANGSSGEVVNSVLTVRLSAETSLGRVNNEIIYFDISAFDFDGEVVASEYQIFEVTDGTFVTSDGQVFTVVVE